MRVAWVDDEPTIRLIAKRIVELSGGTCVGFADHGSMLASREGPFDAAVLQPDDRRPANEVLAELRRRGVESVLISSGNNAEELVAGGIDLAAFDGFLAKPFTRDELVRQLGLDAERDEVAS